MPSFAMLSSAVLLLAVAGMSRTARAATVSVSGHSPGNVQKSCGGGLYFPPNGNGVYGCMAHDGSGIVCGGPGKYAKTCGTWGASAARAKQKQLPSQAEVDQNAKMAAPK
jgi:hypothetical protein